MIYIDPPYNTGHDFVYKDKFGDTIENYREQAGLVGQSNTDASGRYHSNWCSMMYPRLRLARELLSDDGIIFISIDDNELKNIRSICDEIFGESNFIEMFVWEKTQHFGRQKLNAYNNADYIICYAKHLVEGSIKQLLVERVKTSLEDAPLFNASNKICEIAFPAGSVRFNIPDGLYSSSDSDEYELLDDVRVVESRNANTLRLRFKSRWSNQTVQEEIEKGTTFLVKSSKFAIRAIYGIGRESREAPRQIIFTNANNPAYTTNRFGERIGTTENASAELKGIVEGFSYPKPTSLVLYLISLLWDENSYVTNDEIVLDFFSGSGTTADAVMRFNAFGKSNLRYICVQLPEKISGEYNTIFELGRKRISSVGVNLSNQFKEENASSSSENGMLKLDTGFRVLRLDESGITKPKDGQLLVDRVKPDRTDLDIVFEMMLKWGLELSYPVEEEEIEGYPVYSIACDELICCMKPGLTTEVLEAIAERQPRRVFMLDSVIDDTTKLNALQIFKRVEERTQQKIDLRTV